jgi:hypothetical protein
VRRPVVAIVLCLILVLPITFMGALIAIAGEDVSPSEKVLEEMPPDLLPVYRAAAATCDGLEWTVLAAIHKVETGFGRGHAISSAGAKGLMQFMPATWTSYGSDGSGDGVADINNVEDAIYSAAALLCANGAGPPPRLAAAIWSYNHSDSYVVEVLDLATWYGVAELGSMDANGAPSDLLKNPRITLTSNARADLEAGVVDSRLVALLDAISRRYTIGVTVFKSGHSTRTRSGSISNHYYGRGVDIFYVNGAPVSVSNEAARSLISGIALLDVRVRPSEVGHPFESSEFPGGFTDDDHGDHIHLGFD